MTQQTSTTDAGADAANTQVNDTGASETPTAPETFDAWIAAQPEDQRAAITALYTKQTSGLQSALKDERDQRKSLERQLRDAAKSETDGSETQQRLMTMADDLDKANRRADFYADAAKPENGVGDAKAAWIIVNADADAYIDKRGNVNFKLLKEEHPGLFTQAKPTPRANTGSGTDTQATGAASMNDWMRNARH